MTKSRADRIMKKIQSGNVDIRSGFSLWLSKIVHGGFLWIMMAMLLGLYIVLTVWIATNGDLLSSYGQTGFWSFLQAFPYIPLLLTVPVLGAFLLLIRVYDVSYKKPLLGIVFGVIVFSLLAAGLLSRNKTVVDVVSKNQRMFGMGQMTGKNFLIGTVEAYENNELTLKQEDGSSVSVRLTDATHYPFGTPSIGNTVRVVGDTDAGGVFEAVGVRVFDEDSMYGSKQGQRKMDGSGQGKGNRSGFTQSSHSPQQMLSPAEATPDSSHSQNGQEYRRRIQNTEK